MLRRCGLFVTNEVPELAGVKMSSWTFFRIVLFATTISILGCAIWLVTGSRLDATRRLLPRPVCSATSPAGIGAIRAGLPVKTLTARFAARSVCCAQIPYSMVTSRFLARAHAAGLQVHAWTVNDPAVMGRLLDLGVDGIMTDQTALLRDVLVSRGQWHPRNAG